MKRNTKSTEILNQAKDNATEHLQRDPLALLRKEYETYRKTIDQMPNGEEKEKLINKFKGVDFALKAADKLQVVSDIAETIGDVAAVATAAGGATLGNIPGAIAGTAAGIAIRKSIKAGVDYTIGGIEDAAITAIKSDKGREFLQKNLDAAIKDLEGDLSPESLEHLKTFRVDIYKRLDINLKKIESIPQAQVDEIGNLIKKTNLEKEFSTTSPDRPTQETDSPEQKDEIGDLIRQLDAQETEEKPSTTPEKKESNLGTEMNGFVDQGIEASNDMALSIMPNESEDDMSTAQKETFGQIADAIRRVMIETNVTGDTEAIVRERPDVITDTNLHPKKDFNNDVIFRDLGQQVRGELKGLQKAGNKADQREIITKVVQDNIGKINCIPNPDSPVEQVFAKKPKPHGETQTVQPKQQAPWQEAQNSPFAQTRVAPVSFAEKKNNTSNLSAWRSNKKLF